jgi:hypothetical protein
VQQRQPDEQGIPRRVPQGAVRFGEHTRPRVFRPTPSSVGVKLM